MLKKTPTIIYLGYTAYGSRLLVPKQIEMQGSVFYPIKSHHDVNLRSWTDAHL
jgi:hypothetical protein